MYLLIYLLSEEETWKKINDVNKMNGREEKETMLFKKREVIEEEENKEKEK